MSLMVHLRIDNLRQSVIPDTFNQPLATSCTVLQHMSNDSLYFCLSNHIRDLKIDNCSLGHFAALTLNYCYLFYC